VNTTELKIFLDHKAAEYDQPSFIKNDPICIPHMFSKKQDIEIAGFFAALFAWGNRTIIINKSKALMQLMDNAPYDFCRNEDMGRMKRLLGFKHRTFNDTDLLYFLEFLHYHYQQYDSLETAFSQWMGKEDDTIENALTGFHNYFFSLPDAPLRTKKHIATPARNSSCKRLNMYLRWMVRKDTNGVDFGIWNGMLPSQLICPMDVHVIRVAKRFGLMSRKQPDWQAALELTNHLKSFDPYDPVKYDFALFGLGISEKY